jgi:hypothetical protein
MHLQAGNVLLKHLTYAPILGSGGPSPAVHSRLTAKARPAAARLRLPVGVVVVFLFFLHDHPALVDRGCAWPASQVADFGLAMPLDPSATHISHMHAVRQ